MSYLRATILTLGGLAVVACMGVWGLLRAQGHLDPDRMPTGTAVTFDAWGVPTIEGPHWEVIFEAQGRVVASERLWQMDLIRRSATGRLAEWFGEPALAVDLSRRQQGWWERAKEIALRLSPEEREACEAFAKGVNGWIRDNPWRWGEEYLILRARPAPWTCADSVAVLLSMSDQLSARYTTEATRENWRELLDARWEAFLLPDEDPANRPLFGEDPVIGAPLPRTPLPAITPAQAWKLSAEDIDLPGSNAWAWSGEDGTWLANDPHLGAGVPHLWYLVRMRRSPEDWVVGASIPGLHGVVLGRNPSLAWAFTNTGEDVDDLLTEAIVESRYLEDLDPETGPRWTNLRERWDTILVRGEPPRKVLQRMTRRGPVVADNRVRQWLPLLHPAPDLPIRGLNKARDPDQLNAALDRFTFPSQNVIYATEAGGVGYRTSGTGVRRRVPGDRPQRGLDGEWRGFLPPSERPQAFLPADALAHPPGRSLEDAPGPEPGPRAIVNANGRVWVDRWPQHWASERRGARLRDQLSQEGPWSRGRHEALQLDTWSELHLALHGWLVAHGARGDMPYSWDGHSPSEPELFTVLERSRIILRGLLLGAVRAQLPHSPERWVGTMDSAWMLQVLRSEQGVALFGYDAEELAGWVAARAQQTSAEPWGWLNRWRAQHPFVGRVPLLGGLFEVPQPEQPGSPFAVRAESPTFGPSLRVVWDMKDPAQTRWITPVGQSGHRRSPHYDDLQQIWAEGGRIPVFPAGFDWGF